MNNLNTFFTNELSSLDCDEATKSYIIGIFYKYRTAKFDYSNQSITLLFADARSNHSFDKYQNLADWLFFSGVVFPTYWNYTSDEYRHTIGRISYYTCYRLINRQWKSFEEMSDRLPELEKEAQSLLHIKQTFY